MSSTLEVLRAARERIEKPENWSAHGAYSGPNHEQICMGVAICRAADDENQGNYFHARDLAFAALGFEDIHKAGGFNDHHSHPEVLALFDSAIAREERGSS